MPPKIFVVEGNIAAGKSTFIGKLKSKFVHVAEPIDKWMEKGIFQLYNKDPKAYAYEFQTYAFVTRIQAFLEAYREHGPDACYLLERSWHSDRLFARANYEAGYFTEMQWDMYNDWCDLHQSLVDFEITGFVYLKTSASVCYDRLHQRHRSTEELLKLEYLQSLESAHDQFFATRSHLLIVNNVDNDTSNAALIDNYMLSFSSTQTRKEQTENERCCQQQLEIMEMVADCLWQPRGDKSIKSKDLSPTILKEFEKTMNVNWKAVFANMNEESFLIPYGCNLVYIACLILTDKPAVAMSLATKAVANLKSFPMQSEGWTQRCAYLEGIVGTNERMTQDAIRLVFEITDKIHEMENRKSKANFCAILTQQLHS